MIVGIIIAPIRLILSTPILMVRYPMPLAIPRIARPKNPFIRNVIAAR